MLALTAIAWAGDIAPEKVDALTEIQDFPGVIGTMGYQKDGAVPIKSVSSA